MRHFCFTVVSREFLLESFGASKKKRRRSLSQSQLNPGGVDALEQILLNAAAVNSKLNNNLDEKSSFYRAGSPLGPPSSTTHGTSAGFCNICQKFVSNRTNHKYVHSQVKFKCKICGFLYSRKDTLKDHIRGKHNPKFSTSDLNSLVEVVPPGSNSQPAMTSAMNGRKN